MIGISDLSKSFGARTLFEGVTRKLVKGSRYGLVGANGSGKTTFLKILCGDEPASGGQIVWPKDARVGVLRQDRFMNDAEPILTVAMAGDELVTAALAEQARFWRMVAAARRRAPGGARRSRSPRTTATRSKRAPATSSKGSAFRCRSTASRWPRFRAASSCACSWRRC